MLLQNMSCCLMPAESNSEERESLVYDGSPRTGYQSNLLFLVCAVRYGEILQPGFDVAMIGFLD